MSVAAKIKAIHAAPRQAGYERKTWRIISPLTYSSILHGDTMTVYIPGNWSISLLEKYQRELMLTLKEFDPEESHGSGVKIAL